MVHGPPAPLTHAAPFQYNNNTLSKIVSVLPFQSKKKKKKEKRLLVDKIFLEVAQGKEATLGGTFKCHTNFHWKDVLLELDKE